MATPVDMEEKEKEVDPFDNTPTVSMAATIMMNQLVLNYFLRDVLDIDEVEDYPVIRALQENQIIRPPID